MHIVDSLKWLKKRPHTMKLLQFMAIKIHGHFLSVTIW